MPPERGNNDAKVIHGTPRLLLLVVFRSQSRPRRWDGVALSALGAVVVRQRALDVAEEPAGRRVDGAGRRRALGWGAGVGVDGVQDAVEAFRPFSPSSGFKALQAFVTAAAACSTSSLAAFTAAVMVASSLAAMA